MALKPITKYQRYDCEKDPNHLFSPEELARLKQYDKVFAAEYHSRPGYGITREQADRACKLIRDGLTAFKALRVVRAEGGCEVPPDKEQRAQRIAEQTRCRARAYYHRNPEARNEYSREYYRKNREALGIKRREKYWADKAAKQAAKAAREAAKVAPPEPAPAWDIFGNGELFTGEFDQK